MKIIGQAGVEIIADGSKFERQVRALARKIKDVTVNVKADVDLTGATKKINTWRDRQEKRAPLKIKVVLDITRAEKTIENFYNKKQNKEMKAKLNLDTEEAIDLVHNVREEIRETFGGQQATDATIKVSAETAAAEAALAYTSRSRTSILTQLVVPSFGNFFRGLKPSNEMKGALEGFFTALTGTLPGDKIKDITYKLVGDLEGISVGAAKATTVVGGLSAGILALGGSAFQIASDMGQMVGILAMAPAAFAAYKVGMKSLTDSWVGFNDVMSGSDKERNKALAAMGPNARKAAMSVAALGNLLQENNQESYWAIMNDEFIKMVSLVQLPIFQGFERITEALARASVGVTRAFGEFGKSGGLERTFTNMAKMFDNLSKGAEGFARGLLIITEVGSNKLPAVGDAITKMGTAFGKWATINTKNGNMTAWIDQAVKRFKELGSIVGNTGKIIGGIGKAAADAGLPGLTALSVGFDKLAESINSSGVQSALVDLFKGAHQALQNFGPGLTLFFQEIAIVLPKLTPIMEKAGSVFSNLFEGLGKTIGSGAIDGFNSLIDGVVKGTQTMQPAFVSLGKIISDLGRMGGSIIENMAPGINSFLYLVEGMTDGIADGFIAAMPVLNSFIQALINLMNNTLIPVARAFGDLLKAFAGAPSVIQGAILSIGLLTIAFSKLKAITGINALQGMQSAFSGFAMGIKGQLGPVRQEMDDTGKTALAFGRSMREGVTNTYKNMPQLMVLPSGGLKLEPAFKEAGEKAGKGLTDGVKSGMTGAALGGVVSAAKDGGGRIGQGIKSGMSKALSAGAAGFAMLGGWPMLIITALATVGTLIADQYTKEAAKVAEAKAAFEQEIRTIRPTLDKSTGNVTMATLDAVKSGMEATDGFKDITDKYGISTENLAMTTLGVTRQHREAASSWKDISKVLKDSSANFTDEMVTLSDGVYVYTDAALGSLDEFTQKSREYFENTDKEGAGSIFLETGKMTKERLDMMGVSVEAFSKMSVGEIQTLSDKMSTSTGALDAAKKVISDVASEGKKMGAVFRELDIINGFTKNFLALSSTMSTVEEKFAAFKSNLSMRNSDFMLKAQVELDAIKTRENIKTQFAGLKSDIEASFGEKGGLDYSKLLTPAKSKNNDGTITDYFKFNFDSAIPAVRAQSEKLYTVLSEQSTAIQQQFIKEYDTALKLNGGNMEAAQDAALQRIKGSVDAVKEGLKSMYKGISEGDLQKILTTMGISDQQLKLGISIDTQQAIDQALAVERTLRAIIDGDYTVMISAMSDKAEAAIGKVLGLGKEFSEQDYQTTLETVAKQTGMPIGDLVKTLNSMPPESHAEYLADLLIQSSGLTESQIQSVQAKLKGFDNQKFIATVQATVPEMSQLEIAGFMEKLKSLTEKERIAKIEAIMEGGPAAEAAIKSLTADSKKKIIPEITVPPQSLINPNNEPMIFPVTPRTTSPLSSVINPSGANVPVTVTAQAQSTAQEVVNPTGSAVPVSVQPQTLNDIFSVVNPSGANVPVTVTAQAQSTAKEVVSATGTDVSVTVRPVLASIGVGGSPLISAALGAIASMPSVTVKTVADTSGLNTIRTAIAGLQSKTVKVSVTADTAGVQSASAQIAKLAGKTVKVTITADSGPVANAKRSIDSLAGKVVKVTITADSGPVANAKRSIAGLAGKTVKVTIVADTGPVSRAVSSISGMKDRTIKVVVNNTSALSGIKAVESAKIRDKNFSISGDNSRAMGAISSVNNAGVRNKSFTITTYTRTVPLGGAQANGGYYPTVSSFANGGVDRRILDAIERHQRSGGTENRVAQIAQGSQHYRVWGETETGGEAYIPLSKAKRSRSMQILSQVASHFGLQLSKFANGGLSAGKTVAKNISTFANGSSFTYNSSAQIRAAQRRRLALSAANRKRATAAAKAAADKRTAELRARAKANGKLRSAQLKASSKARATAAAKAKAAAKSRGASAGTLQKRQQDAVQRLNDMRNAVTNMLSSASTSLKSSLGAKQDTQVQSNLKGLAKELSDFYKEYRKTSPANAKRAAQTLAAVNKQSKITAQYWRGNTVSSARKIAGDSLRRQRTRLPDYNPRYTLADYERAIESVSKELQKQEGILERMSSSRNSLTSGIASGLYGQFNISSLLGQKDSTGYRPPTSAADISTYAKETLAKMKRVKSNLTALQSAGYNSAIISDIAEMSMDDALAVSDALLKDKSFRDSINSSFTTMFGARGDKNIDKDGNNYVAGIANSIGVQISSMMYAAGVNAQQGLVKGLTSEVSALEKSAQLLASALVNSYKRAMQIKSPSRVMQSLGVFTGQGVAVGLESTKPLISSSVKSLVNPNDFDLSVSNRANNSGIIDTRNTSNSRNDRPITISQTINPSTQMSEDQIGKSAARDLLYRLDTLT